MHRHVLRFLRRNEIVEVDTVGPSETVLDYLRLREGSVGTKEGCCEGDCGACTIALGTLRDGKVHLEPVNACILLLGMVDGKEIITVDDLTVESGDSSAELHPVQAAMVEAHASQCGFCTPGFVMSLFTLYHDRHASTTLTGRDVNDWLAGNLCRCTGYRPIVEAALNACDGERADAFVEQAQGRALALAAMDDEKGLFIGTEQAFFAAPASLNQLAAMYAKYPDATLVGGATDVGLWVTKQLRVLKRVIHLGQVPELRRLRESATELEIGAGVSYSQAEQALGGLDPDIAELLRRIGGKQVRASGTVGGNIANGSPIGDTPPLLIALGAEIELRLGRERRRLPLESYFIDYGKQDRHPGELITTIVVPRLKEHERLRCYKVSKRFDQDITAVLAAFWFEITDGRIAACRLVFGGMAATPRRAPATEHAMTGLQLHEPESWQLAIAVLAQDFQPIDDMRASARYRQQTARALLQKALLEISGIDSHATRVTGHRVRVG